MSIWKCNYCSGLCTCESWYKPIYCTKFGDNRCQFEIAQQQNKEVEPSTSNNTERDEISAICTRLENAFNDRDPESFGYAIIDLQKLSPVS